MKLKEHLIYAALVSYGLFTSIWTCTVRNDSYDVTGVALLIMTAFLVLVWYNDTRKVGSK